MMDLRDAYHVSMVKIKTDDSELIEVCTEINWRSSATHRQNSQLVKGDAHHNNEIIFACN